MRGRGEGLWTFHRAFTARRRAPAGAQGGLSGGKTVSVLPKTVSVFRKTVSVLPETVSV